MNFKIPYSKEYLEFEIEDGRVNGTLVSKIHENSSGLSQNEIVMRALGKHRHSFTPLSGKLRGTNASMLFK